MTGTRMLDLHNCEQKNLDEAAKTILWARSFLSYSVKKYEKIVQV